MTDLSRLPTVTRFAPSPTGLLHLGHAFAALVAYRIAADASGLFHLRMEDIDTGRCRPEYEAAAKDDLEWLGLSWPEPVMRQSERFDAYREALDTLQTLGAVYPCFCTRKDIQAEIERAVAAPHILTDGPDGPLYPGTCRRLADADSKRRIAEGENFALRLRMDEAIAAAGPLTWTDSQGRTVTATPEIFGDVVVARKDVPTSYHLAVVVDDDALGVTLVTRGDDLRPSTHVHTLLQALLGLKRPIYHHHRLILGPDGKKFSKRDRSVTLRQLRESGVSRDDVIARTGFTPAE